ncbi:DUF1275 domain-containing protein [Sphingomonas sp. ID1715]|uniref:YoaK family protein n=1 Tax=Sphingomonas sp. ID1715 TaxID=1656898 RepID=UPI00148878D1|nr:YoaK family protein [Sphingomonas sp. ID1715]NNM76682.1 DUF1275 domain-containing protein [Sphingomonas sp. ID1715]
MTRLDLRARIFAIGLAAIAGFVDAIGYSQSGGFFVSFMSGNSTRLGVGLGRGSDEALVAGVLIGCFVLGVAGGTIAGRNGARRQAAVLGLVAAALTIAALCATTGAAWPAMLLAAFAMGAENATFEDGGEVRVGLTYMTGTLVKIGQRLANLATGRPTDGLGAYFQLWLGLVGGATIGAFAFGRVGSQALWAAAALAAAMALLARVSSPRQS